LPCSVSLVINTGANDNAASPPSDRAGTAPGVLVAFPPKSDRLFAPSERQEDEFEGGSGSRTPAERLAGGDGYFVPESVVRRNCPLTSSGSLPSEGAVGGARSLLGSKLVRGLAELRLDLGPREEAAERAVRDVVVGGERLQRLAGRPAPKQLRVGDQPTRSAPPRDVDRRLRPLEQVVVGCSRNDHGVETGDVVERAQLSGLDHGLNTAASADDAVSGFLIAHSA
jgi:hypothetical protein